MINTLCFSTNIKNPNQINEIIKVLKYPNIKNRIIYENSKTRFKINNII